MTGTGKPNPPKSEPTASAGKTVGRKLNESELRAVFQDSALGIALIDRDGKLISANPALSRMLGRDIAAKRQTLFSECVHPDDRERVGALLSDLFTGQRQWESVEVRFVVTEGIIPWGSVAFSVTHGEGGEARFAIALINDITERKHGEERLAHLAHHDALTGLPNRALFVASLSRALARAQRHQLQAAVMFIDLDHFKQINDSLGHQAGDRLLQQVAERLNHAVRRGDTVARLGGDEFTLILEDITDFRDAAIVAQKILSQFNQSFDLDGHQTQVTPSIGISLYPADGGDEEALVRRADEAMYVAKKQGRASFRFASPDLTERAFRRQTLEAALRQALIDGSLELHYQPVATLNESKVIGAEALLRWRHPEIGLMTPAQFLPLAVETGLILPIGEWVLRTALTQAASWHALGHSELRMAINLSRNELQNLEFPDIVQRLLAETGAPAKMLDFEIPEATAREAAPSSLHAIEELHGMGAHIVVDDFTAGSTDFGLLRHTSIEALKIAPDFLHLAGAGGTAAKLVRATTLFAHNMEVRVIAKGVETSEQIAFLRDCQCDAAQGFLLGRPVPSDEFAELIGKPLAGLE